MTHSHEHNKLVYAKSQNDALKREVGHILGIFGDKDYWHFFGLLSVILWRFLSFDFYL